MDKAPTDWNDLHVMHGLDAVREQIERGLAAAESAPPDEVVFDPSEAGAQHEAMPWEWRLARNAKDAILPWVANIALILTQDDEWVGVLGYCDFSYRVVKHRPSIADCKAGEWEDADTARVKDWLGRKYRFNPSRSEVLDAVIVAAQQARFHPVRDYLDGLVWDGEPRLAHWLDDALGATCKNAGYLAAAGARFLIGSVARIYRPGCKMDNVLILEGEQGKGKSSVVRTLYGDWFSDAPLALGDKDAYQNIQGVWGCELAELDGFNKAESTTAKLFFSQVRDRYRPSYGHTAQDFPRQCVFVGTTNQDEYLKDYSGNRRYWPIHCVEIDVGWVKDQRDQLWAEAVQRFHAGDKWWPEGDDERRIFEAEQDARLQLDPWHYPIEDYLRASVADFVVADDIMAEAIRKDRGHITRADQNRIAPIVKRIGWIKGRRRVSGGEQKWGYIKPLSWVSAPAKQGGDDGLPG